MSDIQTETDKYFKKEISALEYLSNLGIHPKDRLQEAQWSSIFWEPNEKGNGDE